MAEISTESKLEIHFDIMIGDQALVKSSFLVRLIYKFNNSDDKEEETIKSFVDSDETHHVVYSLDGLRIEKRLVRNLCVDACKGLQIKSNKCFAISNYFKSNEKNKQMQRYYKVYQISLKGIFKN